MAEKVLLKCPKCGKPIAILHLKVTIEANLLDKWVQPNHNVFYVSWKCSEGEERDGVFYPHEGFIEYDELPEEVINMIFNKEYYE